MKKNKGYLTYATSHSGFDATSRETLQWFRFMLCTIFMYYKAECLRVTIDKQRLPKKKKMQSSLDNCPSLQDPYSVWELTFF